jgi:hypothetical protein
MNKKLVVSMIVLISIMPCAAMRVDHPALQRQFLEIQRKLGIKTPNWMVKSQRKLRRGPQGTQEAMDSLRSDLNNLLFQDELDNEDIALANQNIRELERLNPARWPRPADYKKVLDIKISRTGAPSIQQPSRPGIVPPLPPRPGAPMQLSMIREEARKIFLSEVRKNWNDPNGLAGTLDEFDKKIRRNFTIPADVEDLYNQAKNQINVLQTRQQPPAAQIRLPALGRLNLMHWPGGRIIEKRT